MRDTLSESRDRAALIRIVAIGSPHGDDSVGLVVGRRLATAPPPGCAVIVRDRPGIALLDDMEGAAAVLLIDATATGAEPGAVLELDLHGAAIPQPPAVASSHGLGVAEAIALGRVLQRLPPKLGFLGIEIARVQTGDGLSDPVRAALDEVEARARAWANRTAAGFWVFP